MLPRWLNRRNVVESVITSHESSLHEKDAPSPTKKWHLGILGDKHTDEVPGSVILLSNFHKRNEPLGLQHAHGRTSASSLPSPFENPPRSSRRSSRSRKSEKKRSQNGKFILEPQPEESANDPLNWPQIRRDVALLSLGFYCMVGGGMTPLLAAAFNNVASTYEVTVPQVALTTGLYMLGLGLGSVIASPTAILWGKRPVYLVAIVVFMLSSIWCALSPNYASLVVARIVQGFAVSPVECLPSATVAEIFFLHERAYRLGIYTLLLLGGKNIIPLVSAAVNQSLGWRWIFWVVAMVVGFCFFLIFFFVPETFWDRTPRARDRGRRRSRSPGKRRHQFHLPSGQGHARKAHQGLESAREDGGPPQSPTSPISPNASPGIQRRPPKVTHAHFAVENDEGNAYSHNVQQSPASAAERQDYFGVIDERKDVRFDRQSHVLSIQSQGHDHRSTIDVEKQESSVPRDPDTAPGTPQDDTLSDQLSFVYTDHYRTAPPKTYVQSLKPWNGRLAKDKWLKVMVRPFILFAYPAVLWSSLVYALAVGWLIVLSESVAHIYQNRESYNFTSLQCGLVYISPFVGGVLGTAVAGKVSDIIVRYMSRKNDGVYEPEFRLVMAIPITLSTTIGLMGFGWSAEEKDLWIVPTIFFGVISFGCSLASTTAVTFVVDSYRVYAGEALVTLNFAKNILHGFVFSLFFTHWLEASGPKDTFVAVGGIQLACMLFSIPMYIFGKRARMWTARKNLMEKF
ncbi:major facilitator superfamily domain-containing protein [Lophiotrema nucula]|uniref:Major facilitator superfamily domain-containing protein n=1 Tax=Lophiotrema nucula TaxID=690887 RepID=A0A6A5YDS7_9PLEO|nr:major facilitator superfamily domain-containing protein [Lophiotrema nucula]